MLLAYCRLVHVFDCIRECRSIFSTTTTTSHISTSASDTTTLAAGTWRARCHSATSAWPLQGNDPWPRFLHESPAYAIYFRPSDRSASSERQLACGVGCMTGSRQVKVESSWLRGQFTDYYEKIRPTHDSVGGGEEDPATGWLVAREIIREIIRSSTWLLSMNAVYRLLMILAPESRIARLVSCPSSPSSYHHNHNHHPIPPRLSQADDPWPGRSWPPGTEVNRSLAAVSLCGLPEVRRDCLVSWHSAPGVRGPYNPTCLLEREKLFVRPL